MNICELHDVSKSFGKKIIFDDFSLLIKQGEQICITGKSGSGKSTLLNIMGLLENPDSGIINICGATNVKANSRQAQHLLRTKIGFLFQNFALIDDKSVNYNLDIACINLKLPKSKWNEKKIEVLKDLQLDISLQEKVYNLSGGEQQRLALGRILLKNCDLILADEPTGSLDIFNRDKTLDILSQLNNEGKTIVLISHDPYIVSKCHRVIEL